MGAALGLNPWKTPEDLIRQMVRDYHGAESEFTGNIATEYGHLHEPLAIMDYMGKTGHYVEECGFFVHPEHDWLGATPDGLIEYFGLVEVKCPFGLRNKPQPEFKAAADQPHYYAQMQVEMASSGRHYAHFYQWSKHGDDLQTVDFDPEWWGQYFPEMEAFYNRYLSELDNPAHLEGAIYEVNTLGAKSLLDEYDALKTTIDDAEARKKEVMAELVKIAKERNAILWGRKLTKVERAGSVAYAKIVKEKLPELDVAPWTGKPSEYWRLS
ncbi:MAG: YqaJ viral recombinase family protein [Porticoccaceae bacterium]|nr:YqaJ viral recombinase family protein [Porticoccaceae bacterium]